MATARANGPPAENHPQEDHPMQLPELLRAVHTLGQTGGTPAQCEALARQAMAFADMVGWASGPIDPEGALLSRLAALQSDLELRYAQTRSASIAAVHDSLTDLGRAIARHDDDLCGERGGDTWDEDLW
jgi:hypothetical protein